MADTKATATAEFEFIKPLGLYETEKPYRLYIAPPKARPDLPDTNVVLERVSDIPVHDVRGRESNLSLNKQGFEFIKHDQVFTAFDDDDRVQKEFLPQVEETMRKHIPNAHRIFIYDCRLRQEKQEDEDSMVSINQILTPGFLLSPSELAHTDTTEFSLKKRVRQHFPDEADQLLQGRVQFVNFWRPLYSPVYNYPLFLCDARTVKLDRLVAVDQVFRHFIGEIYYATHDAGNEWHYQSAMKPSEGILFKSWDTAPGMDETVCIHASSALPQELLPEKYEPRMSIECRALVFSDL